jgi:hypothetical protein
MTPENPPIPRFTTLPVRDLVRRKLGDDPDRWDLALVQRDEKWDQVRMRYLLDSLLAGYPIGSLLLCRIEGAAKAIRIIDGIRTLADAEQGSWQLLDGQQRINALSSILTPRGRFGAFYLDMGVPRPEPRGPVTRRRARDEGLGYIHWQDASEADKPVPDRARRIDLGRWYEWAEGDGGGRLAAAARVIEDPGADVLDVLTEIDPDFTDDAQAVDSAIARERLRRLISIWRDPTVPVEYRPLRSMKDVLEAFTRVNRAGVQVAGLDLFFAAVRTLWPDAEPTLEAVVRELHPRREGDHWDPLVGRMTALRVLTRLASRAADGADLLPLVIDRLAGDRGDELINIMRQLARHDIPALRRMRALMGAVASTSRLGFGLYEVDGRAWDAVLGWSAVSRRGEDPAWLLENIPAIDSYLLGVTSFRYIAVLGDRFGRDALSEALAAGAAGEPFPVDAMPGLARRGNRDLRGGRDRIRALATDEERLHFADANHELLLSVVQKIEYRPQRDYFDWDHIYPYAKASLMTSPGRAGRRVFHRDRRYVSSAGNFWALDAGTNRAMQDQLPGDKFRLIRDRIAAGDSTILPRDRWWLSDEEIETFGSVGSMLERGEVDEAMDQFRAMTLTRAARMVAEVLGRFPSVRAFASDADVPNADARPSPPIAEPLGVVVRQRREAPADRVQVNHSTDDQKVQRILRHADEFGCGAGLRRLVDRALAVGLQVRGYKYALSITPPRTKSIVLITITPRSERDGRVTTWVADPGTFVWLFPDLPASRFGKLLPRLKAALLDQAELDDLGDRLEAAFARDGTPSA